MLGGLLAGSLLGSLLFGGGFNGGGFLDIILIGGLLFLAFKFFSRRRAATQAQDSPMRAVSTRSAARPAPIRRISVRRLPKAAKAVLTGRR